MKAQMKNFEEKTGFILTITFRTHHRLVKHRKDNRNTLRRCYRTEKCQRDKTNIWRNIENTTDLNNIL